MTKPTCANTCAKRSRDRGARASSPQLPASCRTASSPTGAAAIRRSGAAREWGCPAGCRPERAEARAPQSATHPILVDRFLEDATEVDVDCISDGETVVIGAIMEHIEEAGIHSGDTACVIPPFSLKRRGESRDHPRHQSHGPRAEGPRLDERAVRREGRRRLRDRGQPARLPHRAVRLQSHRRSLAETRRQNHGREDARRNSVSPRKSSRRISP